MTEYQQLFEMTAPLLISIYDISKVIKLKDRSSTVRFRGKLDHDMHVSVRHFRVTKKIYSRLLYFGILCASATWKC